MRMIPAPTIWLMGLSGAGKTTLAEQLKEALHQAYGIHAEIIDGDTVRSRDPSPLGYTREERIKNIHRIIELSRKLNSNNVPAIVASIHPYMETRAHARATIRNYFEIFLDCQLHECVKRDVKGLYSRAEQGKARNVVGLDEPFEPPIDPDLVVDTAVLSEAVALRRILLFMTGDLRNGPM